MLANGAEVDCGKEQGLRTALFESAWGAKADPALTKLLLSHDAAPNALTAYDGTPLHSAAMWGNAQIISALLAAGANK
jgi:ankyrin repeat protein